MKKNQKTLVQIYTETPTITNYQKIKQDLD